MQLSPVAILGYLCVLAGFLVIVASVVFVIKGRAVLSESGAPNAVAWGKIKANLTSIVALFVLGLITVVLPFYLLQKEESRQPREAILKGKISGAGGRVVRLIFVEEPDSDRDYKEEFTWRVPLIPNKEYSVLYVIEDKTIVNEQSISVKDAGPGSASQNYSSDYVRSSDRELYSGRYHSKKGDKRCGPREPWYLLASCCAPPFSLLLPTFRAG